MENIAIEVEHETELYIYFYVLNDEHKRMRMSIDLWDKFNLKTDIYLTQYIEKSKFKEWEKSNIIEEI